MFRKACIPINGFSQIKPHLKKVRLQTRRTWQQKHIRCSRNSVTKVPSAPEWYRWCKTWARIRGEWLGRRRRRDWRLQHEADSQWTCSVQAWQTAGGRSATESDRPPTGTQGELWRSRRVEVQRWLCDSAMTRHVQCHVDGRRTDHCLGPEVVMWLSVRRKDECSHSLDAGTRSAVPPYRLLIHCSQAFYTEQQQHSTCNSSPLWMTCVFKPCNNINNDNNHTALINFFTPKVNIKYEIDNKVRKNESLKLKKLHKITRRTTT